MDKITVDGVFKSFPPRQRGGEAIVALDNVDLGSARVSSSASSAPAAAARPRCSSCSPASSSPPGTIAWTTSRSAAPAWRRIVVFQDYALFPWMTVDGERRLRPGDARVPRRRRARARRAPHRARRPGAASSVAIRTSSRAACASASRSRARWSISQVLLMDEPFAALDAQNRLVMQEQLLRLWTHPANHVLHHPRRRGGVFLGDRVYVMTAARDVSRRSSTCRSRSRA